MTIPEPSARSVDWGIVGIYAGTLALAARVVYLGVAVWRGRRRRA